MFYQYSVVWLFGGCLVLCLLGCGFVLVQCPHGVDLFQHSHETSEAAIGASWRDGVPSSINMNVNCPSLHGWPDCCKLSPILIGPYRLNNCDRSKTAAGGKCSVGFEFSGCLRLISICRRWIGGGGWGDDTRGGLMLVNPSWGQVHSFRSGRTGSSRWRSRGGSCGHHRPTTVEQILCSHTGIYPGRCLWTAISRERTVPSNEPKRIGMQSRALNFAIHRSVTATSKTEMKSRKFFAAQANKTAHAGTSHGRGAWIQCNKL